MNQVNGPNFSTKLQSKISSLKKNATPISLGSLNFDSPLLLAPMSAICNAPFRLLMQNLGAGGSASELISCHGINYGNEKTRQMLYIHPLEKNMGIQLFGEDQLAMAKAAVAAQEFGPSFIDINMGCPVRKVVTKGGGSALLKEPKKLSSFFKEMKKVLEVPLTIKIRTGWDEDHINAKEVINIAEGEGVEFVAIHGRTRAQQYKGLANWDLLESLADNSPLPIIGNGDLHSPHATKQRLQKTKCHALMLGRGPLRDPFIFLQSMAAEPQKSIFEARDYLEIIQTYYYYLSHYTDRERTLLIQMRKMIVWFAAGFDQVALFRGKLFSANLLSDVLKITEDYMLGLDHKGKSHKKLNFDQPFMAGGHG